MKTWSGFPTAMIAVDVNTEIHRGTEFPADSLLDLDRIANSLRLPIVWGLSASAPSELVSGIHSQGASDVAHVLTNDVQRGVDHCALASAESAGGGLDRHTPVEFCRSTSRHAGSAVVPHRGSRGRWLFPISIRFPSRRRLSQWWSASSASRAVPRLARASHWVMVHVQLEKRWEPSLTQDLLRGLASLFEREGLDCVSARAFVARESVRAISQPAKSILHRAA